MIKVFLQTAQSLASFKGTINLNISVSPSLSSAPDVRPEYESLSSAPDARPEFPYLTKKCFQEKRVDTVKAEIQAACKGTAESLWRTLWNNENLGYVEVEYINATTLYRDIEKWYGKLSYTERNFRKARNKR